MDTCRDADSLDRIVILIDMDAFFANCEKATNPELRNHPVAIAGRRAAIPGKNVKGVVTAANRLAKVNYGIKTAMSNFEARRIAPNIIYIPSNGEKYLWYSQKVNEIVREHSNSVEPYSIDELFLDVTFAKTYTDAAQVGMEIKRQIKEALDLPCTVGISENRFLAKMACEQGKPDGLFTIHSKEQFIELYKDQAVSELWGIGSRMEKRLWNDFGVKTIEQLRKLPREYLKKKYGVRGDWLSMMAHGEDDSPIGEYNDEPSKSFGHGRTMEKDSDDPLVIERLIFNLAEKISKRMREGSYGGRTIGCWVRYSDFHTGYSEQRTIPDRTDVDTTISRVATEIYHDHLRAVGGYLKVRAVGVWVSQVVHPFTMYQGNLYNDDANVRRVLFVMDRIRAKYGDESILKGIECGHYDNLKSINYQTARRYQSVGSNKKLSGTMW